MIIPSMYPANEENFQVFSYSHEPLHSYSAINSSRKVSKSPFFSSSFKIFFLIQFKINQTHKLWPRIGHCPMGKIMIVYFHNHWSMDRSKRTVCQRFPSNQEEKLLFLELNQLTNGSKVEGITIILVNNNYLFVISFTVSEF